MKEVRMWSHFFWYIKYYSALIEIKGIGTSSYEECPLHMLIWNAMLVNTRVLFYKIITVLQNFYNNLF